MRRRSARPKSLRTKLIAWTFAPTAIILVAVALVAFFALRQVTEVLGRERGRSLAYLSARQVTAQLQERSEQLSAVARTVDVYQGDPSAQRDALKQARPTWQFLTAVCLYWIHLAES